MKSITKLYNKAIFHSALKINSWIAITNFSLLFVVVILPMIAQKSAYDGNLIGYINQIKNYFNFNYGELQMLIMCVIPVAVGILLTRFMQNKGQNIHIHSMPVDKKQIFISHMTVGIILLIIPILLSVLLFIPVLGLSSFLELSGLILNWTYVTLALELITFAFTVFVGTLIGSGIVQTIFTYILMLFPLGIYILTNATLKIFLLGYSMKSLEFIEDSFVFNISILPQIFMLGSDEILNKNITQNLYLYYIIFAFIILIASYFIYKVRKAEKTGDIVTFIKLSPILKYGITFCFMLLGGLIIFLMFDESLPHLLGAYVIVSAVAYFLAEMLIRKSVAVLDSYKGYVGYVLVIIVVLLGVRFDILGFENRIPNIADVKEVEYTMLNNHRRNVILQDKENIKTVADIHKAILEYNLYKNNYELSDWGDVEITYILNNGNKITRQYDTIINDLGINPIYQMEEKIFETMEYKKQVYHVLNDYDIDTISHLEIDYYTKPSKIDIESTAITQTYEEKNERHNIRISDKNQIMELLDALKKDTLALTYEQSVNPTADNIDIRLYVKTGRINKVPTALITKPYYLEEELNRVYIDFYDSFENSKKWLEAHNYLKK